MTVGKGAKSDQRLPVDKATEMARKDRAPDLEGAGGPEDSEVVQSAVAALGAPVLGAAEQAEERKKAKARGQALDVEEIPGVSGRVAGREAPTRPARRADELERNYREGRPGEASARQADPNAAPTPLQRLEEDDDLN